MNLIIDRVINNNVVASIDNQGREIVVMGKGVGFHKSSGDIIEEKLIEKVFTLEDNKQLSQFTELLNTIDKDVLNLSIEIIEQAKNVLNTNISSGIYISLLDHINFALQRKKEKIFFENPLYNEIRIFYPSEYQIGEFALGKIFDKLNVALPIDEAATIAMHFVKSEYRTDMDTTWKITMLTSESKKIVENRLNLKLDPHSLDYSRFVTHLKFLCQRLFIGQMLKDDDELTEMIIRKYPFEFDIAREIADFIEEKYEKKVPKAEEAFLTIHIYRVSQLG